MKPRNGGNREIARGDSRSLIITLRPYVLLMGVELVSGAAADGVKQGETDEKGDGELVHIGSHSINAPVASRFDEKEKEIDALPSGPGYESAEYISKLHATVILSPFASLSRSAPC